MHSPLQSICNFSYFKLFIPKSSESIKISGEYEEKLWTYANNYARTVRQRTFYQETRQVHVSMLSLFLTNKQDDRGQSGVNQSQILTKPLMLIQLKVTQNETKNTLNSLITFIHTVKKKKRKKEAQLNFPNTDVRCLST